MRMVKVEAGDMLVYVRRVGVHESSGPYLWRAVIVIAMLTAFELVTFCHIPNVKPQPPLTTTSSSFITTLDAFNTHIIA
jgi:hypothetical protein